MGQPTPSSRPPAVNQATHCGTYQGSVNKGGSYMPTTVGYGRVTWIKSVWWASEQPRVVQSGLWIERHTVGQANLTPLQHKAVRYLSRVI